MKKMKRWTKSIMMIVLPVLILTFAVTGTVNGKSLTKENERRKAIVRMERDYTLEIRNLLKEEGYKDSGVTMTHVAEADGGVSFTVTIHHRMIGFLTEADKEALKIKCRKLEFPIENCSIYHDFLETDL